MEIVFLGTGAGNGVPEFYCNCDVCLEARKNSKWRRTRSSILISDLNSENPTVLIDAPPELSSQLLRENINQIDYLFLTHAHHDHTAGLGDIEIYSNYHRKSALPAVMSYETLTHLEKSYPAIERFLQISIVEPGQSLKVSDLTFMPLEASHVDGTLGYIIENSLGKRAAYIPDTGPLNDVSKKRLANIDKLILDTTFWGKNWFPSEHHNFEETVSTAREVNAGELYLTHLSMHYSTPVTNEKIENKIRATGEDIFLTYDGMRIRF